MTEITLPTDLKVQNKEENEATIIVAGCYPGYGITLANSLRRVLLSSLKGAAVTSYQIEGVDHEFTTIPDVMEDAIQIGLNLKQVRFKVKEDKDYTVNLAAKGEGEVTGADLDTPSGIEVVNKDTSILTLTNKDAELNMELAVSTGYGLESSEERKEEKLPIGTISLDAFYSPVRKVSYDIEEMRIGERTDYNKIIMTVKTDGTIKPEEALQNAAKILKDQFSFLEEEKLETEKEEPKEAEKKEKKQKPQKKAKKSKSASDIPVDQLELPTRVVNILKDNRIKTAAGLTQRKKETLVETEGLGEKSVEKIDKALSKYDLKLK